ncbi:MAG: type II toxin-antitoxin system prevent-host-death family antitoxin [Alphaproteobacteria bacterium]|nr:type II toxin-antitoxin system prevent-host-death family antitoxin [Alphaproteobacteria bacterium]
MAVVKIHEAKTNLSKLIARAEAGEEIVIARGDKPVVKVVPVEPVPKKKRTPGAMKGIWPNLPDAFFFDSLPEEELAAWEGRDSPDEVDPG